MQNVEHIDANCGVLVHVYLTQQGESLHLDCAAQLCSWGEPNSTGVPSGANRSCLSHMNLLVASAS